MTLGTSDDEIGFFSDNGKLSNAVWNIVTETSRLANSQILPPKQAEVFGFPAECYSSCALVKLLTVLCSAMDEWQRQTRMSVSVMIGWRHF